MQHSAAATLPRPIAASAAPLAAPLAGLAGTDLSRRFRHWRGRSGRRHLFSVFPVGEPLPGEDAPRFADAVVMAVGRDAAGAPRILALDETGALPDLFYDSAPFRAALARGAEEIHVHLLADGPTARAAVLRDLDGA
ncbi:hypothetical protein D3273_25590 [Lichenibacterium minor]|uniref:Uncharacterized protein n=1 Tax=Lichenibacterium minor TaxID=2316528 RepID=A0A4Q2U2N2_9HYPH|nr:hypothetical protein [Lichenibacterium minor]RYC29131.1 hypothetical protein D3273_25590 [Lichenibacterium minor]